MTDFAATRAAFHLPEGTIYGTGKSLGPIPVGVKPRAASGITGERGETLTNRLWDQPEHKTRAQVT